MQQTLNELFSDMKRCDKSSPNSNVLTFKDRTILRYVHPFLKKPVYRFLVEYGRQKKTKQISRDAFIRNVSHFEKQRKNTYGLNTAFKAFFSNPSTASRQSKKGIKIHSNRVL